MGKLVTLLIVISMQLSGGIGSGKSGVGALPVELTSFTASRTGANIELRWTTATEVNNYGFEVQKSVTGNENSEWETLGFVKGNGNSNSPKGYSFTDHLSLNPDNKIFYRLKQIDNNGKFEYSKVIEVSTDFQLSAFDLKQNYPNPFNPSTVITYSIPASSNVIIEVYNVLGNLITTLVNKNQDAGSYKVNFDAGGLSNGIYYYKIEAGSYSETKKMLLLK